LPSETLPGPQEPVIEEEISIVAQMPS
jgi:hypothetical protein